VAGLAFLARTDNGVLLPLAVAADTLVFAGRDRSRWSGVPGFLGASAAVAALIALPWFIWNIQTFGTPWQVSGVMKFHSPRLGGHIEGAMAAYHLPRLAVQLIVLGSFLWRSIQFAVGEGANQWPLVILLSALAAAALALLLRPLARNLRRSTLPPERALAAGCATYLLAHMFLYTFAVGFYANWYTCVPTLALLFLVVGLGADAPLGAATPARRGVLVAALGLMGVAMFASFFAASGIRPRGWELVARGEFAAIAQEAPGARTIGYQSAGVAGYFAPSYGPYRVVNLDGLVNNEICKAWLAGRYFEYLDGTVDVVRLTSPEGFGYLLGPEGRARFAVRFPQWTETSPFYGPRPGPPGR
jgi:hypothetical protein